MKAHPNRYLDPLPPPGSVYRISVDQYDAMFEHGILSDDEPVWLLEGIIVWKGAPLADPGDPEEQKPEPEKQEPRA